MAKRAGLMRVSGDGGGPGCPESRFGPGCWSYDAVVVLEQPRSDQPFSPRALCGVAESFTGALFARGG